GHGNEYETQVRVFEGRSTDAYKRPLHADWNSAPDGVDILRGAGLIQEVFPSYADDIQTVIHIRRAGAVDGQQMGQIMLERFRAAGGQRRLAEVTNIGKAGGFELTLRPGDAKADSLRAVRIVNAAGPFLGRIAGMLGSALPVTTVLQQKIAFEDTDGAIPRAMPFSIDLDGQQIDWTDEDRDHLSEDPDHAWLAGEMPGAIHCRPDGGDRGTWIKIGWAYNEAPSEPTREPVLDDYFPEVVIRGAARLNPGLKTYYGRLPRNRTHYGGFYTMTDENWPLIGPTDVDGCFIAGAMSGFGTMAACGTGDLVARWMLGRELPDYAEALSYRRADNAALMAQLHAQQSRGIL
ncbi:MAG: FAD-binding oxidoreductase, partial [Rhodospirillaceae bacterium]|nr:FAD-binding oxidoreductase [Rhodospirillaceae bacterium]